MLFVNVTWQVRSTPNVLTVVFLLIFKGTTTETDKHLALVPILNTVSFYIQLQVSLPVYVVWCPLLIDIRTRP